jgi:hypothetical protein
MRYAPRAILACGLGFALSFVVACGGESGLLSGDQSNALSGQADQFASAVQARNCGAAASASEVLNNDVHALTETINATVRSNLIQGASTIAELARKDCHRTASTSSTTSSTTTTTSTSTSSTSTSTSTPTTTSSTSTTSSTATTPTETGNTSTTTGGVGIGGGTTTDSGNGSGGTGPGQGNTTSTGGTG